MESPQNSKIISWVDRVNSSSLSVRKYFSRYKVPFSIPQYFRYKKKLEQEGPSALTDNRNQGNNRKLTSEAEGFLVGYLKSRPRTGLAELQALLKKRFDIEFSKSGMSRCLKRFGIVCQVEAVEEKVERSYTVNGGFEIIIALALHLGWPQAVEELISNRIHKIKQSNFLNQENKAKDSFGRNELGQFTDEYNKREDVRSNRFKSIEDKRGGKNFQSMSISSVDPLIIQRKCLAILSLPILTDNGAVRTVDAPAGNALSNLCGFNYKQGTVNKFLSELKYIGISGDLLKDQVGFWQKHWKSQAKVEMELPLLCYYIDGNTKAFWSKKRVKKNKVTMNGKVMGCLEHVFVHDNHGRPVYFETYSGHAPMGEYILSLFAKIEKNLKEPEGTPCVNRVLILDGASNSVRTLRAFAEQKKYHYTTSLDDNQWSPRKIRKMGRPQRYRYGQATLRDCDIELKDSQDNGFLIIVRAIKIDWDNGKCTILITSLNSDVVGASEIVKAYFDRWPFQELQFRYMKAVACLNRVAGYGKQIVDDPKVLERQKVLQVSIATLKKEMKDLLGKIAEEEQKIASLVKKEYPLRRRSQIDKGERIVAKEDEKRFLAIRKEISKRERNIKALIKPQEKSYRKLRKAEREWTRLQGREKIYKADVELDQIMTFFRVGFVNLCSYLTDEILNKSTISLNGLLHSVLFLPAVIDETKTEKRIALQHNPKDPHTMSDLTKALARLNSLKIKTLTDQEIIFKISDGAII